MARILIALIVSVVGFFVFSTTAYAATIVENGNIQVNGVIKGPPPQTPPTIDTPVTGAVVTDKNIPVSGTCVSDLIVKLYRNNVFAGSTLCVNGRYTIHIDLALERNDLVARQYDADNQASPDSNLVTVYYRPLNPAPPTSNPPSGNGQAPPASTAATQLLIHYDYTFQGIFNGESFTFPVQYSGGVGPYAVSIDWGDGVVSVFSKPSTELFTTAHSFTKAGYYTVVVRVADSQGRQASLQLVIFVHGTTGAIGTPVPSASGGNCGWTLSGSISAALALGGIVIGIFISFLLRRRPKHVDGQPPIDV